MPHKMMNSQIADVLHDNRLSIEARMQYAYLCSFDDGAPPSTCQIIRQLGIGKTRFYRYRNELEAFGLIEVENTITSGGGVAKYSFPDEPVPTAEAEEILINRLINNNNKAMRYRIRLLCRIALISPNPTLMPISRRWIRPIQISTITLYTQADPTNRHSTPRA